MMKLKPHWWFWVTWLLLCSSLGFWKNLQKPPYSMHQGAQADRACVAWNYYHESMNFFLPRVMESRAWDGIAGMEFPALPYTSALLYKIFGFHDGIYRAVMWFIVSFGVYAAWLITGFFVRRNLNRLLLVYGWYLSPVLVFYTPNFLPDPAALSFSMLAWYFFFRFYFQIQIRKSLWLYTLFISLAGLIKVSFLITHFAIFGLCVLPLIPRLKLPLSVPVKPRHVLWFIVPLACVGSWYSYSAALTRKTWNVHFLQQPNPAKSWAQLTDNTAYAFNTWYDSIYAGYLLYFVIAFILITIVIHYRKNPLIAAISGFLFLGFAAAFILFNTQFRYHDYYFILLFPFLFFGLLLMQQTFVENRTVFIGLVPIILMLGFYYFPIRNFFHSRHMQDRKYGENDYYNQALIHNYSAYDSMAMYLNKNIPANSRIMLAFDPSPNTGLYLLQRKGVRIATDFPAELAQSIAAEHHIKYVVINDSALWNKNFTKVFGSIPRIRQQYNNLYLLEYAEIEKQ
ncbi:MAG: hypothetical protein JNL57_07075 [Bacteroidetes bacterium]|nr:hypothetical protein [Bacteroidota bacterium]